MTSSKHGVIENPNTEYKRNRVPIPLQSSMDSVIIRSRGEMSDLVDALVAKLIDPAEFVDHMADSLQASHTQAVVMGRHRAGDWTAQEEDDSTYAAQVMDGQAEFLDKFRQDLEDGDSRYVDANGDYRRDAILNRATMYSDRVTGSANEAFALTSGDDRMVWNLGGEAHCPDCPRIAEGSPYKASELPTVPMAGGTQCLMRCRCWISRSDGVQGFRGTD